MGCLLKANGLYSRTTIGAVLLAAGAGSRLGHRPKALLELGGVPLIVRQCVALSGAGVDELVVVLGHHADAIEPVVAPFPITIVRNPMCMDPPPRSTAAAPRGGARPPSERPGGGLDQGQHGSVRLGLQALSPRLDAVIVALADQPLIGEADIVALIGAFKKRGDASMVVPRVSVDGQTLPGNPVIFDAALRDEWLAGESDAACRKWRTAHPERVRWFHTDNRRFLLDIDTPDDLTRFAASTGHTLRWPAAFAHEAPE